MFRLLAALLVLALPCFLRAQGPLFQILDNPIPVGATPPQAIGDLDGDGDADLISANGVFLNDGHGRFTAVPNPPLTFPRFGTTLADLNNDGLLDVVSIDYAFTVRIDLNLGGLSFVGPIAGLPALPASPISLATGDVDQDGDVDILVGVYNSATSTAVLWLNNGSGAFTPTAFPAIQLPVSRIFLADLDADGDLDALVGGVYPSSGAVAILTNVSGTFIPSGPFFSTPSPWTFELGHFNSDAFPDLIVSAGPSNLNLGTTVFFGSAAGFLAPVTTYILSSVFIAIDVNGDGIDELAGQSGGGIGIRSVGPSGTVGPVTQSWPDLTLVQGQTPHDLDGDGDLDLIASGPSGPVALMNAGNGSLVIVGGRTAGLTMTSGLRGLDLDGDGDGDIIGRGTAGVVTLGRNDGSGWFAGLAPTISLPGGFFASYSVEPFDGDGDGDSDVYAAANSLVVPSPFNDLVFANVGGAFTQVATVTGTGMTTRVKAADIDGDGDQDILLARNGGPMLLLANLGGTGFGAPIPFGSASHATYEIHVGDFDGNGFLDVFQLTVSGLVPPDWSILWLNSGAGFTAVVQTGISGHYSAAGDLNGDTIPDLVIDSQVWFSTGAGSLNPGPVLSSTLARPASLADVDQDGDLDLVESPATVFFNAGGGNFGPPVSYLPRPTFAFPAPQDMSVVVDVDHDGDLDIVAPGPIVLVNTTRQIAHGSIARPGRPASIDLYGTPGGAWFLWASNGTTSLPFPPWGIVQIDPASALLGGMGTFTGPTAPLPGTATLSIIVPNNPALIGWITYWQSIDAAQMRFTNRIQITVLGY